MLYVFHVDVGRMMTFDMTVALSSVQNLKDTIERLHGIPAQNIVLLVSGGEVLTSPTQVSYYSAGTDTNPIYMFLTGDGKLPPALAAAQSEPDMDLREQVERCLELPAVYETVMTRAQLAMRMHDMARDEERLCERLVHEQHLQQQGWSAVVANMEDLTEEFRQRFRNFCVAFDRHLEKREAYLELLRNFGDDLTQLARIPILPGLMPLAEADFHGFDAFLDTDEVFSRSSTAQESVIMAPSKSASAAGAADGNETAAAEQLDSTNANSESGGGGVNLESKNSSSSTSSTSPNKKLKMGNDGSSEGATSNNSRNSAGSSTNRRHSLNLLQWITSRENHNALKLMSDECNQGLGTFNEDVYEKLKSEVQHIIKLAEQSDVKEIKGLGKRLCNLDEFKYKIKSMVQDQKEHSTAFQQNQSRAINLRDVSILPDLCASHKSQLVVMQQNHQKIRDHRRCIARAKDELGANLHTRLKRIVWIENAMSEFDNRLLFYHRCLRRAERHINIIEQLHQAPCIYVAAVTEVVRRKIFSGEFSKWASKLAEDFDSIHTEEIKRRQVFNASFEGHFLNILFPGMADMPPAFANEHPLVFDASLPNLTNSDIDVLTSYLPDLASQVQLPDMRPVINFFVSRSGEHQRARFEQMLREQVANDALMLGADGKSPQHQRLAAVLKEECCDESAEETDTETEFEQVQQVQQQQLLATASVSTSTSENQQYMARSTLTERLLMQSAETLTEENEESMRAEVERLKGHLAAMSKLSLECLRLARANLQTFRLDAETYHEDLQSELQNLNDKWNVMRMQCDQHDQQMLELGSARDEELLRLRALLDERNSELEQLRYKMLGDANLEHEIARLKQHIEQLQGEREEQLQALRQQLTQQHKTEIESLRCRFKLMTSMEHSPSEASLDNIERPTAEPGNSIELSQHEAAMQQLRCSLESERERAIMAAVEAERSIWQLKIFPLNSETVMGNVSMLKDMLADKERQLEQFREKDLMLTKENYQLKTRLDALTNEEGNSWLKEKIDYLNRDKSRLEEELNMEKSRRLEMESSFAAVKGNSYEPAPVLTRSKSAMSSHKYIVLDSCSKGDIVFVVWSMRHCQFMVVQDSPSLFFVHGDSLAGLNLRLPLATPGTDELPIPMPYYAIGRVIEKEYCQARKEENRYRVTRGSKFYRIKLAPLTAKQSSRRERLESFSSSVSRSISQCETHSETSVATVSAPVPIPLVSRPSSTGATLQQSLASAAKDFVDGSLMATSPTLSISSLSSNMGIKERTISVTSVAEVDEESELMDDRSCYMSAEEETLQAMDITTTMSTITTTGSLEENNEGAVADKANSAQVEEEEEEEEVTEAVATLQ